MKKTSKKKSKLWVCPHGCPVTKVPCPHLEGLLPKYNKSSIENKEVLKMIERTNSVTITMEAYEEACGKLLNKLMFKYKLPAVLAHITIDRFVSNLSIKEIGQNYNLSSQGTRNALEFVLERIKQKGF